LGPEGLEPYTIQFNSIQFNSIHRIQVTNVTTLNRVVGKIIFKLLLKRMDGIHPAEDSNLDRVLE